MAPSGCRHCWPQPHGDWQGPRHTVLAYSSPTPTRADQLWTSWDLCAQPCPMLAQSLSTQWWKLGRRCCWARGKSSYLPLTIARPLLWLSGTHAWASLRLLSGIATSTTFKSSGRATVVGERNHRAAQVRAPGCYSKKGLATARGRWTLSLCTQQQLLFSWLLIVGASGAGVGWIGPGSELYTWVPDSLELFCSSLG